MNSASPPAIGIERGLDRAIAGEVLGRHRLLEPGDVERLDPAAEADRRGRIVGVVGVDHDGHLVADRAAHRLAQPHILVDPEAELELDRGKPLGDALVRLLDQIGERIAAALPIKAGGIGLDARAQRPAQQPMHRQPEMAGLQIPQRDVDRAQGLDREALLAVVAQPVVEALPDRLGRQRVGADQERLVEFDDRRGQARRAERLAPAAVAVLADDLDEARAAPLVPRLRIGERLGQRRFEDINLDVADFHFEYPRAEFNE